jgi:hypothetical protein
MRLGGVGGQHHTPAALLPVKTRSQYYRRLGWTQGRSGLCEMFRTQQDLIPGPSSL